MGKVTMGAFGVLIVVIIILAGWAFAEQSWRKSAQADALEQRTRAELAEAEVASKTNALASLSRELRAAQERARVYGEIRQAIAGAANGNACASSPAVRTALDRLFRPADGAPGNPPGANRASAPAAAAGQPNRP